MAVYKRGDTWWYSFIFCGKRIQESAKTPSKTIARKAEENRRRELEKTLAGIPIEARTKRILSVSDVVVPYPEKYSVNHRPKSVISAHGLLGHIQRHLGGTLLPDLHSGTRSSYIRKRQTEKISGRTINMELSELSARLESHGRFCGLVFGSWKRGRTLGVHCRLRRKGSCFMEWRRPILRSGYLHSDCSTDWNAEW